MNSFRSWVRKYMKTLEGKDKLFFKDLFFSGLFRLIARTIKVFVSFVSIILTAFDFKRRKVLSEFDKFFLNLGKEDLVITSVSTTCGCTVTDFPKDPVKPGEGGTIEVTFNSSGKSGKQAKVITVATNANPSESQLTIKANVKKP